LPSSLFDVEKASSSKEEHVFNISTLADSGWVKISVDFESDGRKIGSRTFYFFVKRGV
jgi:hypothetical protein